MGIITALGMVCSASAEEVKLAVGRQLPPYVIEESIGKKRFETQDALEDLSKKTSKSPSKKSSNAPQSNDGMEIEIVRESLKEAGDTFIPIYTPLADVPAELEKIGASGLFPCDESIKIPDLKFSDSHISYRNVAISLKDANLKIDSVADLAGKKVTAFQNAKLYLGDEFSKMAESNPDYAETPLRGQQIMSLFYDKTADVLVMDENIFKYYLSSINKFMNDSVVIHKIFPESKYKVGFFNAVQRDRFNKGLSAIKASGKYDKIVAKYENMMKGISSPDEVKVACGKQLPPYVITQTDHDLHITKLPPFTIPDEGCGMELDIIRLALEARGKKLVPVFLPLIDVKAEMLANGVHAVAPCDESIGIPELSFSDSHISYKNVAISNKKKNLKIKSLDDMKGLNVVAFQNAKLYLGPEFAEFAKDNKNYSEVPLRGMHTMRLVSGDADVIIMDEFIFKYRIPMLRLAGSGFDSFAFHDIFQRNDFKVGFLDKSLRDEFNAGLKEIKKDGRYDKVLNEYAMLMKARSEKKN